VSFTSCSGNKQTQQEQASSEALSVDDALAQADANVDKLITIEGVCTHTCKHGATKIFLQGSDNSNVIRCEGRNLEGGAFSKDCVKNVVRVTGYVRESRIDEAYLQNWKRQYEEAMMQQQANVEQAIEQGLDEEEQEKIGTSAGCSTEAAARREQGNTIDEKIANYREQIAARKAAEGKEYLSFYHIEATAYEIVPATEE
jgi:hypothetical protein